MLRINSINLTHFKNYKTGSFSFGRIVGVCGLNGVGKTNLLDAIYYSCFTKSYFSVTEGLNTAFEQAGFRIQANFEISGKAHEIITIYRGNKKEVSLNQVAYEKLSKHIGLLPIVIIAPDDIELITGASEKRRRFLDTMLSQADAEYLENLIVYNKVLQQRNSLLRQPNAHVKHDLLDIFDEQLMIPGKFIFAKRKQLMEQLAPLVSSTYSRIAGSAEVVKIEYISQLLSDQSEKLLAESREKDLILQRTTTGIHKDDIGFTMNEQVFRYVASQGQRKSMLFALKLAEYEMLRNLKGFSPILLLDDVFEKLDDSRMYNLLKWVCQENEGQVIITDTHRQRLEDVFRELSINGQVIELN